MTKEKMSQNVAGEFVRYPLIHRLAFEYAQKGYQEISSSKDYFVQRCIKVYRPVEFSIDAK